MPKRVITEQWICFDGVPKRTETEANAYELRLAHIRVTGLTIEQVESAISRADLDLADAFEEVARRIKRVRLGRGAEHDANGAREATQTNGAADDGQAETAAAAGVAEFERRHAEEFAP